MMVASSEAADANPIAIKKGITTAAMFNVEALALVTE